MCLAKHNIPFARVNPRQARRFCEGTGQLAKTDQVDAKMLAKMGALLELELNLLKTKKLHYLNWWTPINKCSIHLPGNGRPGWH
jgi:transposase